MRREEGFRKKLIEFIVEETIKINPTVIIEKVKNKLSEAGMDDLIDLTIIFMKNYQNRTKGYYGEK